MEPLQNIDVGPIRKFTSLALKIVQSNDVLYLHTYFKLLPMQRTFRVPTVTIMQSVFIQLVMCRSTSILFIFCIAVLVRISNIKTFLNLSEVYIELQVRLNRTLTYTSKPNNDHEAIFIPFVQT